jgi:hypothetical protein
LVSGLLSRLTLAEGRASGPFTTRWYNDPVLDGDGRDTGATEPVWSIAPDSVIVSPAPEVPVRASVSREVWGWAWADGGVRRVYVRTGAEEWRPADIDPPRGREWQRFSFTWAPAQRGAVELASLAEARNGLLQPAAGRRNTIHRVTVSVI